MTKEKISNENKTEVFKDFNSSLLKNIPMACYSINSSGKLKCWNNLIGKDSINATNLSEILPEAIDIFKKNNFSDSDFDHSSYGSLFIIHPDLQSIVDEIAMARLENSGETNGRGEIKTTTNLELASKEIWKELLSSLKNLKTNSEDTFFDKIYDLIWKINSDGKILFVNKIASKYLELSIDKIVGKSLYDFLDAQSTILIAEEINSKLILGNSPLTFGNKFIGFNGSINEFETKCSPVYDSKGNLKEIIGISRELKDRKQKIQYYFDELTKLSKSVEQKDLILDLISHDLKNSVNVISGISQILLSNDKDNEIYNLLYDCSNNLLMQLEEASKFAQLENGEKLVKQTLHLRTLIQTTISRFSGIIKQKEISIQYDFDEMFYIKANSLITSVIDNFISNALKYNLSNKKIVFFADRDEDFYTVKVCDLGVTIPEKKRKLIFERGIRISYDTKPGKGLGLSIARKIVEAHQGEAWVEPNYPTGNRFCFKLPVK